MWPVVGGDVTGVISPLAKSLSLTTVLLNLYFLKNTGLELIGIALATGISLTLFNLAKIMFNYWKFRVSPFSIEMMFALILGTLAISVSVLLPEFKNNFLNLVYKPAVVLAFFFAGNHFLKIFPIENYLNKNFLKSLFKF